MSQGDNLHYLARFSFSHPYSALCQGWREGPEGLARALSCLGGLEALGKG